MRPLKLSAIRALCLAAATLTAPAAQAQEDVMVVFDGSNSMWGQIEGVNKIVIARDVMGNLLGDWTENRNIGLMAYGHRRRGDCTDIELLVQPGADTRQTILDRIGEVVPTGKTPLTTAVEQAARELSYTDRPATVVLISDGLESCERDPCALAEELERSGVGFTAHVVGFGLGADEDTASLACIADKTGGTYVTAGNAQELAEALNKVAMAVAEPTQKPTPEPLPEQEPEPAPEPEPELPEVTVNGPANAIGGANITVTWEPTLDEGDYITVVPVGTKEGTFGPYDRIGKAEAVSLPVPGEAGAYEIRYINRADRTTLGSAPMEVTAPEVTLTAADTVSTGAMLEVAWTPTVNARDTVTIVPLGAETGASGNYAVTRSDVSAMLQAPAAPGLYEIRYLLAVDKRTVASRPLEVTEAAVTLDAPETALAGGFFNVGWSDAVNPRDYITIVAVGADEGTFGTYITVRDDAAGQLRAPADTGLYEVRYVLREGSRTIASVPLEVTAPEVTVSGPATALTGARIDVSWTGTVARDDYITIVPVGTDEGEFGNYITVRDHESAELTMPAETGLYELRYVLREGSRTLATAPLEVIAATVAVTGPETALAGSKIEVSWTGTVARDDYITIVPVGTDEGEFGNYITVRNNERAALTMPAETGLYELRYVLRQGSRTLASAPIEVVAPEVSVAGPETALAGSVFQVSWTGTVNTNDYVTIVPVGSDPGVYGNYFSVRSAASHDLQAPAEPGMYEIRYVLREDGSTLATAMIELTEPEVTISAPEAVRAGDSLPVSWTGTVSRHDYVTLVPTGTPDDTYGDYFQVRQASARDMKAPEETGLYEVRYMLREGGRVLARQTVEILAADATLETGASVTAPDSAAPGSVIEVGWTSSSTGADQRITLARADQAIFTWISAVKVADEPSVEITLPDTPGAYEIRLLDVSNQDVLTRKVITVE